MATIISSKTSGVGGLSVTGDASGVLQLASADGTPALTIDASQNVGIGTSSPAYKLDVSGSINTSGSVNSVNTFGFKNRIINGGMVIDQRNAGASVTPVNGQYLVDRFWAGCSVASKYSVQQNAGAVTPPVGFTKYLGATSLSAYSVVSSDALTLRQTIEGFNIADLGWGTANAQTVTLSFWVRSSLTGTFGGALNNSGYVRSYPFTYTISVANTWEQKTITIAGDTSGTWATDNTTGVVVGWSLGAGTPYSGTAGSWATATYTSATGAVSVVGTSGATFYITGVQLEKGSLATSFDYRPYGTELALCQRYFEKSFDIATAPAQNVGTAGSSAVTQSTAASLTSYGWNIPYKVTKRATPSTVTLYNPAQANAQAYNDIIGVVCSATVVEGLSSTNFIVLQYASAVGSGVGQSNVIHWAANSEL